MDIQIFIDIIKSKIQEKDDRLSCIPDLWNQNPRPLYKLIILYVNEQSVIGLNFNDNYRIEDNIRNKIEELFKSDKW